MLPDLQKAKMAPVLRVGNIITTRVCWMGCPFCDLSVIRAKPDPGLSLAAVDNLDPHLASQADLIKLHGGLMLKEPFDYWLQVIRHLRDGYAGPVWAFSPQELWHFHQSERRSIRDLLAGLKWAGATALNPGGSESLGHRWSSHRLSEAEWLTVAEAAARAGISLPAALIVPPSPPETLVDNYLSALAKAPIASLEIKPLRSQGTRLAKLGDAEMLELIPIIERVKEQSSHAVSVRLDRERPDAQLFLSAAGADRFFVPTWTVEP